MNSEFTRLPKLFLALHREILSARPASVVFKLHDTDGEILLTNATGESLKTFPIPGTVLILFVQEILKRETLWPDYDDALFATNPRTKRICLSHHGNNFCIANTIHPKSRGEILLTLGNFQFGEHSLVERLSLLGSSSTLMEKLLTRKSGIVLAPPSKHPGIGGAAIFSALRPDAHLLSSSAPSEDLNYAVKHCSESLWIIESGTDDPVETILDFAGLIDSSLKESYYQRLQGVFTCRFVKRTCASCAKSVPVAKDIADKVPAYLLPPEGQTYLFGLGCEKCGHSAYRGLLPVVSVSLVTDETRTYFSQGVQALTNALYAGGTRTLFEDGLEKIFKGMTSFEAVYSTVRQPSIAFGSAISTSKFEKKSPYPDDDKPLAVDADFLEPGDAQPRKPQLLIIEDDIDQREILSLVFQNEGFEVEGANNGKTALSILSKRPFDAVICDLMMPEMNGAEFVKAVRHEIKLKSLPVLMLTAIDNAEKECELLEYGADDYCAKTIQRKVLVNRVRRLIERNKNTNPVRHLLR